MRIEDINFDLFNLQPDGKILDLGCGRGSVLLPLWRHRLFAFGLDLNRCYLNDILSHRPENANGIVLQSCGEHLPFKAQMFDVIVCREVLEHVSNPSMILLEAQGVLKPKGFLCITIPYSFTEKVFKMLNPSWLSVCQHKNVFSIRQIKELIESNGFHVIQIERKRFFYSYFWFFHCIFRTAHDGTGQPLENHWLSDALFFSWSILMWSRVTRSLLELCNYLLPKSIYLYCKKKN